MDDSFIKQYIGELLRSLRTQYLIDLIKPYTRLELAFLAKVWRSFLLTLTPRTYVYPSATERRERGGRGVAHWAHP